MVPVDFRLRFALNYALNKKLGNILYVYLDPIQDFIEIGLKNKKGIIIDIKNKKSKEVDLEELLLDAVTPFPIKEALKELDDLLKGYHKLADEGYIKGKEIVIYTYNTHYKFILIVGPFFIFKKDGTIQIKSVISEVANIYHSNK
jgi:hypothetical protein